MKSAQPEPSGRYYISEEPRNYQFELTPVLFRLLANLPPGARVLDAGCGNGFFSGKMLERGYRVTGIDVSQTGIEICRREHPQGSFHQLGVGHPDLPSVIGDQFDAVVALEVIEHLYSMKEFLDGCKRVLSKKGILILSTPYHGYAKNLWLALSGRLDAHFQAGHEGGHIKFWSRRSLESVLLREGFHPDAFTGCGRLPYLWKSMLIRAVKDE